MYVILHTKPSFKLIDEKCFTFMLTCPDKFDPLKPRFRIVELRIIGVYIIFLIFDLIIDFGDELGRLNEGALLTMYALSKNKKNIKFSFI